MPVCGVIFLELDDCWGVDWVDWGVEELLVEIFYLDFVLFADLDWLGLFFGFLVGLDFYFFGDEFLGDDIFSQTFNNILITLQLYIKNKSKNISSSLNKLNLKWIMKIKTDNFRCSL